MLAPGSSILCAIVDSSGSPPVRRQASTLAETGRGLHVVGELSDHWGYAVLGDLEKVVWALFSTSQSS